MRKTHIFILTAYPCWHLWRRESKCPIWRLHDMIAHTGGNPFLLSFFYPSRAIILLPNSLTSSKATTVDASPTTLNNGLLCSTIHMCNASIWSCVTVLYSLIPLTEVVQELIHSFSCLLCMCCEVKSRFNPPVPRNGGIMIGVLYEPEWYVHYKCSEAYYYLSNSLEKLLIPLIVKVLPFVNPKN